MRIILALTLLLLIPPGQAQTSARPFDAAAAFGARSSVYSLSLSPDGRHVAYLAPLKGQGAVLYTMELTKGAHPKVTLTVDGRPNRLGSCYWIANDRLLCYVHGISPNRFGGKEVWDRLFAVDSDGSHVQMLNTMQRKSDRGITIQGGGVIDWLPKEDGTLLIGTGKVVTYGANALTPGGDAAMAQYRVNTRTLESTLVMEPVAGVTMYFTDTLGEPRIRAARATRTLSSLASHYYYRASGSSDWRRLGNAPTGVPDDFRPMAIVGDLAYGVKKVEGRQALYAVTLDGTLQEKRLLAYPDGDVVSLIRLGLHGPVVGAYYLTETEHTVYFQEDIRQQMDALHKALPDADLLIIDASADQNLLLLIAHSDHDPGVSYLFDRRTHHLETFLVINDALEGVPLAHMQPIHYPGEDGTQISGYLVMPPGKESAKDLPAVVIPLRYLNSRLSRNFDWIAQYLAHNGYAVLLTGRRRLPEEETDTSPVLSRTWPTEINDLLAAGRWLVRQGTADPDRLAVLGLTYGGYRALQSVVVDPGLFKAVIGIGPVSDLQDQSQSSQGALIGSGPRLLEGSPIHNIDKIKVPVLLFHGGQDEIAQVEQSRQLARKLKGAHVPCDLVIWEDLDQDLEDSAARTQLLTQVTAFLRTHFEKTK